MFAKAQLQAMGLCYSEEGVEFRGEGAARQEVPYK